MGFMWSQPADPNIRQQQELMLEMQSLQLERQIHMRQLMHQRMLALKIAKARELFFWCTAFYAISTAGLLFGYRKTKAPAILTPLVPLTFIVAYQGDLAYGSKLERIKGEAENILGFEPELLQMPLGTLTVGAVDEAREKCKDEESFSKAHDIFL